MVNNPFLVGGRGVMLSAFCWAACLLPCAATPSTLGEETAATAPSPPPLEEHPTLQAMWRQNNAWRQAVNLPAQKLSPTLTQAAQDQAWFMAAHSELAHDTNGGLLGRVEKVGYGYKSVRENIAWNQKSVAEVFDAWKNSPGHWANMTAPETEVGCGYAVNEKGEGFWAVVYGTPLE